MLRPFVSFQRILENVAGTGKDAARVCIMAGGEDKLVDVKMSEKLANLFREAAKALKGVKKLDGSVDAAQDVKERTIGKSRSTTAHGVRFVVLEEAPHHFQNDVHWGVGAKHLLAFMEDLRRSSIGDFTLP
ncbi:MAG: hypothetical protein Q9221_006867 [Calogaya cf. arnoldii]